MGARSSTSKGWRGVGVRISLLVLGGIVIALASAVPSLAQQPPGPPQAESGADPHGAEEQAAERQALGFLGYLDHGRFADSYAYTGMLIRSQLDREAFASQVEKA